MPAQDTTLGHPDTVCVSILCDTKYTAQPVEYPCQKLLTLNRTNPNFQLIGYMGLQEQTNDTSRKQTNPDYGTSSRTIINSALKKAMASNEKSGKRKLKTVLLHNEGNYKQGEKTAFRMGENNSK